MSERLEEIKRELAELKDQWNQGYVKNADYAFDIADSLINRVEELENLNASLSEESRGNFESAREYKRKNQRYKQALEEIIPISNAGRVVEGDSRIAKIARQALAGEET